MSVSAKECWRMVWQLNRLAANDDQPRIVVNRFSRRLNDSFQRALNIAGDGFDPIGRRMPGRILQMLFIKRRDAALDAREPWRKGLRVPGGINCRCVAVQINPAEVMPITLARQYTGLVPPPEDSK